MAAALRSRHQALVSVCLPGLLPLLQTLGEAIGEAAQLDRTGGIEPAAVRSDQRTDTDGQTDRQGLASRRLCCSSGVDITGRSFTNCFSCGRPWELNPRIPTTRICASVARSRSHVALGLGFRVLGCSSPRRRRLRRSSWFFPGQPRPRS
jgi:hypothetical protein